jgi:hypothetical protein
MYNGSMTHRTFVGCSLIAGALFAATLHAQEVVRKEAPPEIRQLIGAVVQAVNGAPENFESFAQERFSPELLKQQSAADRHALHQKVAATFGEISIGGVRREGPDGPMLLQVKGSKADGVIEMEIDTSAPPRITLLSPQ